MRLEAGKCHRKHFVKRSISYHRAATINFLWGQKNKLIFQDWGMDPNNLVRSIVRDIRAKLSSMINLEKTHQNRLICGERRVHYTVSSISLFSLC